MSVRFDSAVNVVAAAADGDTAALAAGAAGFIAIFVIGGVTVLLLLDMNRRVRRARYREQVRAELDAEEAAGEGRDGEDAGDGTANGSPSEGAGSDDASRKDPPSSYE